MFAIPITRRNIILLALFILIVLAFIAFWFLSRVESIAYKVERKDAIKGVTVSGTVEALQDILLATEVTAKIKEINFQEGAFVERGQVLALLDRDEITGNLVTARGQLNAAEAEVRNLLTEPRVQEVEIARAQVDQIQENINVLQQELQRTQIQLQEAINEEQRLQQLYQQGAVSLREFERAGFARAQLDEQVVLVQNQIQGARAQLAQARQNLALVIAGAKTEQVQVARGQVQAARGGVQSAQGILEDYIITAPVTGYIVEKILEQGEIASPTSPVFRLVQPESLYMSARVEENELGSIEKGQAAYIIFDAYPSLSFTGEVFQVSKNVDPITGTFEAKVTVPNQKGRPILVGMTSDVTIVTDRVKNVIIIPNEFIITENGKRYVLKKVGNKAVKTYIEGVIFDNNRFRVTKGLKECEIIVKGANEKKVNPGDRIKVVENYRD